MSFELHSIAEQESNALIPYLSADLQLMEDSLNNELINLKDFFSERHLFIQKKEPTKLNTKPKMNTA